MIRVRLRVLNDDGSNNQSVAPIRPLSLTYTSQLSGPADLRFQVSRKTFVPSNMPFLIRLEYSINGSKYQALPEHNSFIIEKDADDSKDNAKVVTYEATEYVWWMLAGAYVGTGPWEKDGERTINGDGAGNANAGQIMRYFIDESKSRGWLPRLGTSFFAATDSNGVSWTVGDRANIGWRLETFYPQVLSQLTEQGLCDWTTTGHILHLYRPGTLGVDRSNELVFGGPEFDRVPVKTDSTGWYTHVVGLSEAGRVHVSNAAAEARFGRRSAVMSQTGVKDTATSTKLANQLLADGLTVRREEAYEWTPGEGGVHPFRDFQLGDMVSARSRGGKLARRAVGLILTQGTGPAKVQVRVGEKITTLAARNQKKLSSVAVGGVQGGSGGAFPTSPPLPDAAPDAPDGLIVTSNTGSWGEDGTAHSTVELSWSAVTQTPDGAEIDVASYEVWSRPADGALAFDTQVTGTTAEITSWEPDRLRLVVVYAISTKGVKSAASLELPVTPVFPSSVVPKAPTGLTIVSNVGSFTEVGPVATVTVGFTAVTLSTDDELVAVAEYELWDADGPLSRFPASPVVTQIPSGADRALRVRAMSVHGVWGDLSSVLTVTGAAPAVVSRAPSDPVMSTSMGNAFAMWNGEYSAGGAGAHTVRVEARVGTTGDFVQQAVLTGPTNQLIRLGAVGDMVQVRFRAYDQLGRLTGTSAVKSVVVEGVPFESFDDAAQDRIIDTETAVAAVETGQILIGRTVDGLNRAFTSIESPGRGYLGYENLAPKIEPSGVWAEYRRNRALNPRQVSGGSSWERATRYGWLAAWRSVSDHPTGIDTAFRITAPTDQTVNGRGLDWYGNADLAAPGTTGTWLGQPVTPGETISVQAWVRSSMVAHQFALRLSYHDGAGNWVAKRGYETVLHPGVEVWQHLERVDQVPADATHLVAQCIMLGGQTAPEHSWFEQTGIYIGAPGPYFDGSTPDRTVDPDMRQRWLGTPNESGSVMEIERVLGLTGVRCVAGVSTKDGKPAARLIPSGGTLGQSSYAWFGVPINARSGGTLLGTVHSIAEAPHYNSSNRRLAVQTPWAESSEQGPASGSATIRYVYGALTSTNQAILYGNGAPLDSGDVWWTDIGLYAGEIPADAQPFHNGDEWRRLDWMPGENPGDPDRLVIVEILVWDGQDWAPYGLWLDSLAAAGSVTARTLAADEIWADEAWLGVLRAGVIETDMVTPNFGENLNLTGNRVNIDLTQRVDDVIMELAAVDDALADTASAADAAADAAAAAQQEISTLAQGRVLTAEQALAVLSSKIDTYENSFSFESDGLHIREAQTASAEMILAAAGMRLNADGTTVAEINQGQMIIAQIITSGGRLGNHLVDSSIAGHTTWRLPSS